MTDQSRRERRICSGRRRLGCLALALVLALAAAGAARANDLAPKQDLLSSLVPSASHGFKICENQTYALCAVAKCFVFNGVSYCRCNVKKGDSISLPFNFDRGEDVCSVNQQGAENGYMVSTFSLPPSAIKPIGDKALYDCPASTSNGAYAQCDGGICFTSSQRQSFPGFNKPLRPGQIMCACPITVANPATAKLGYQIAGPYPCQRSFFQNCRKAFTTRIPGPRSMSAPRPVRRAS